MFGITPSARLRPSPFYEATVWDGVCAFTTYSHMLMPTSCGKPQEEYWRLINGVSQWDVGVERQVQLKGPKAEDVVAHVCGDWVRGLKYFWFRQTEISGIPVVVQRSGWSKQGGFEIYLRDGTRGTEL